ncbi:extracellular substrate-binding orphan/ GRRM family protein [Cyanobium sp. NS01]|nr:extracellular substrate-binding orphan/ GRRM family protein [Cyanobium sp. NS01]
MAGGLAVPAAALAGGAVERVARSGELVLVGPADAPPLLSGGNEGQPQGYAVLLGERIAAELARAVGRPVRLRLVMEPDLAATAARVTAGTADLACGIPFSWEADMTADFSMPIGVSGLRLLAPAGRFDGNPAALTGRPIGVVRSTLAETELQGMQPEARLVPFANLSEALDALEANRVEGVIGDTKVLAALARARGLKDLALVPDQPFESYGVACLLPENDSAFRNLVDLAIARLLQGYVDGRPEDVAAVDRWLAPGTGPGAAHEQVDEIFQGLLLGREAIRPLPAADGDQQPEPGS